MNYWTKQNNKISTLIGTMTTIKICNMNNNKTINLVIFNSTFLVQLLTDGNCAKVSNDEKFKM